MIKGCSNIVIGANFGDEGKGRVVDWLASNSEINHDIVIRYSSGGQCSHTVDNEIGRHVFGHIGSGTLRGLPTYLSRNVVLNPKILIKEFKDLQENFNISPKIFVNENCIITLPYDILINHMVENARENNKHGSCGIGFNETIVRNNNSEFSLNIDEFLEMSYTDVYYIINKIKTQYFNNRMTSLNCPSKYEGNNKYISILNNIDISIIIDEIMEMLKLIKVVNDDYIGNNFDNFLFEGSQGLLLDKSNTTYFPHLTNASVGASPPCHLTNKFRGYRSGEVNLFYVTRPYLTRHGNGPMYTECGDLNFTETTNKYNEFQGKFRFGILDIDYLFNTIKRDYNKSSKELSKNLVITCMDQIEKTIDVYYNKARLTVTKEELLNIFKEKFENFNIYYAKDKNTIIKLDEKENHETN